MESIVSSQLLVVFIESWVEELDCSHFGDQIDPRLLQDLKISHGEPSRGGKAQFTWCTAGGGINFCYLWMMGTCNVVREGQFRGLTGRAGLPALPMVGMLLLGDVGRSGAMGRVDSVIPDMFHEIHSVGVHVMILWRLPHSLEHLPKGRAIKHEAHDA